MVWLPVTVAMVGKFLISMTFAIAYLYTAELFPTKVRNVAVGTASTFARIGSISAPYIVDLLVGRQDNPCRGRKFPQWQMRMHWSLSQCPTFYSPISPQNNIPFHGLLNTSRNLSLWYR